MRRVVAKLHRRLRNGASAVGMVALVAVTAPSAAAGAPGAGAASCAVQTCISVAGEGRLVYRVSASATPGGEFFGHFKMYGGGLKGESALRHWRYGQPYTVALGRTVPDRTVFCAEGWEHVVDDKVQLLGKERGPDKLKPRGRACVQIRG
ncbi:hypothetical protein LE181_05240 [Streptomyces sp. SCA3-4]|uniref:hypothetical protein n=1 Tax=Streptomyces sichuanensis TaxID=2871810 RepID=UPI001CE2A35B|nr:hypothetical protein [Streptomyces sichuanensis]MCA6091569.1 hypothetical protein [Streptomyces sichuanensis]